jgi:DNA-binding response OmpR family regulator
MSKRRVFIAEDSPLILISLEMVLEQNGFEIAAIASTTDEAEKHAAAIDADIAILDINLHGQLTFAAARLLAARGIPIIFSTGYALEGTLPPQLEQATIIQKPYDPDRLIAMIECALGGAKTG